MPLLECTGARAERLLSDNDVPSRKVGLWGMKLAVLLLYAALLGGGWQATPADEDTLKAIEVDEFHRTIEPVLVASLDAQPRIAARAALAIGRTKRPEGAAPLRAHIDAADPSVRALVTYGLGLLGDAASAPQIRALARSDPSSAVRYAAVDALGPVASTIASKPLRSSSTLTSRPTSTPQRSSTRSRSLKGRRGSLRRSSKSKSANATRASGGTLLGCSSVVMQNLPTSTS